jgi:hypothetical protein
MKTNFITACLIAISMSACGEDPPNTNTPPFGAFGEVTSVVIVVNPAINQGSSTTIAPGPLRSGVSIQGAELPPVLTDPTGLALIQNVPTGPVPLKFDSGAITLTVQQPKELYDVVVSYTSSGVREVIPPVRYPIGGQLTVIAPGGNIAAAAANDNTIVFLQPGNYPGNFELPARNVLIFGAWSPTQGVLSIIEGDITVRGGDNRLRGVRVTGTLTSAANNFSAAFCDLAKATITGNGVSLIRNLFVAGQATVPSSNAVLVDNLNIP